LKLYAPIGYFYRGFSGPTVNKEIATPYGIIMKLLISQKKDALDVSESFLRMLITQHLKDDTLYDYPLLNS